MGLDIRVPIGLMFAIIGALLALYGVLTGSDAELYRRALDININLWWGVVMLVFGLIMFFAGRRGASGVRPAADTPEGRITEEREHRLGLEK